ncbi:MAG: hypothetical protein Q9182_004135 [Xanthomendoza sp. 2 TL-2023]
MEPVFSSSQRKFMVDAYTHFDITYSELALPMAIWKGEHVSAKDIEKEHMMICQTIVRSGDPDRFSHFFGHQSGAQTLSSPRHAEPVAMHHKCLVQLTVFGINWQINNLHTRIEDIIRDEKRVKVSSKMYEEIVQEDWNIARKIKRLEARLKWIEEGNWPRDRHWPTTLWNQPRSQEVGPSPDAPAAWRPFREEKVCWVLGFQFFCSTVRPDSPILLPEELQAAFQELAVSVLSPNSGNILRMLELREAGVIFQYFDLLRMLDNFGGVIINHVNGLMPRGGKMPRRCFLNLYYQFADAKKSIPQELPMSTHPEERLRRLMEIYRQAQEASYHHTLCVLSGTMTPNILCIASWNHSTALVHAV